MKLPQHWQTYARLQREADRNRVDRRYWAVDDAADEVLDRIAEAPDAPALHDASICNLVPNRAKKFSRRAQILRDQIAPFCEDQIVPSVHQLVETMAEMDRMRGIVTEADWDLLTSVGYGDTYAEIADRLGETSAAIKMRVSRLRKQLH